MTRFIFLKISGYSVRNDLVGQEWKHTDQSGSYCSRPGKGDDTLGQSAVRNVENNGNHLEVGLPRPRYGSHANRERGKMKG